jgi:hypothetical protein
MKIESVFNTSTLYIAAILILVLHTTFTPARADSALDEQLRQGAAAGDAGRVKALLEKGALINSVDKEGVSALMEASFWGKKAVVELLLEKGADVNAKNKQGETALTYASKARYTPIMRLLIGKGAEVNAETSKIISERSPEENVGAKRAKERENSPYKGSPEKSQNYSFSLPFFTSQDDPNQSYPPVCLADLIPLLSEVVLVSRERVCDARTTFDFKYEIPSGVKFEATALDGKPECLKGADVAVVEINAEAVRVIPLKEQKDPPSKDIESRARTILKDWMKTSVEPDEVRDVKENPLSNSSPGSLKAAQVEMLQFSVSNKKGGADGPVVLFINNQPFRLGGWRQDGHIFFSVKDKIHLAYTLRCWSSGKQVLYVYDLSGPEPKKVYENNKLSD